jgi:flavin-binding protein dodecin
LNINLRGVILVKKGIELVGTSQKDFSEAVQNAIKEASETLRGIEWVRVEEYTGTVEGDRITQYQARVKVYFDVER